LVTGRIALKEGIILIPELPMSGIYTLILFVPKEIDLNIGKLGKKGFQRDTIPILGQP